MHFVIIGGWGPIIEGIYSPHPPYFGTAEYRACLITLHSNFEIFQKGHPAVEFMLDRRIFERWFRITPTWRRVKMLPWQVIGKKLHRSRDITWHGHLREKFKFFVSVRVLVVAWVMVVVKVMVRVKVECYCFDFFRQSHLKNVLKLVTWYSSVEWLIIIRWIHHNTNVYL